MIVLIVLLPLAACATHQTVARKPAVDPDWWLGPLSEAHDHLLDAAFKACPPQGFLSNEQCVYEKLIGSFAKQNDAATHCPAEPGVLLCADLLTATERIYRVLGIDPQQTVDWDDPYESLNNLERLLATRLTSRCPDTGQKDCVAREMAGMLAISQSEAASCIANSDANDQVRCATALVRIEGYRSALRYFN